MPHRDPETGQFVAHSGSYTDYEVVTFTAEAGTPASDLDGETDFNGEIIEFEGLQVIDYDDVVDRNETLQLLSAHHVLEVYGNSTSTADGYITASLEVSSSPSKQAAEASPAQSEPYDTSGGVVRGGAETTDTIDLVGRPLIASTTTPFSDGASGVGGGGAGGHDAVDMDGPPGQVGMFHPRDELFVNGEYSVWNVSDSAIHAALLGQHIYGVVED
jgi:hypothetical protein